MHVRCRLAISSDMQLLLSDPDDSDPSSFSFNRYATTQTEISPVMVKTPTRISLASCDLIGQCGEAIQLHRAAGYTYGHSHFFFFFFSGSYP